MKPVLVHKRCFQTAFSRDDVTRILWGWNCGRVILSHHSSSHFFFFLLFFELKYSKFTTLCQFLLYSTVTQSYLYIHSFSHIIFYHGLSQEIGYSSLGYTRGPHCLYILKVTEKYGMLHKFAYHPCMGAILIFSVSFQF